MYVIETEPMGYGERYKRKFIMEIGSWGYGS
jgi:hypothetical protein